MNPQIKKGVLDLCILQVIAGADKIYGYELTKKINAFFPEVNESTLYSILRRLHSNGYTTVMSLPSPDGPQRKYYKISPEGQIVLEEYKKEWFSLCGIVEEILTANLGDDS